MAKADWEIEVAARDYAGRSVFVQGHVEGWELRKSLLDKLDREVNFLDLRDLG